MKVGIVGAGLRGSMLAGAIEQNPEIEIVGAAEPNETVAQRFSESFGVPSFSNATLLYDGVSPDAVIIATPDFAHEAPALEAAQRGIHSLIEKPFVTDLDAAYRIAEAAKKSGALVVTAFENRWNPVFTEARAAIESGEVGDVVSQYALLSSSTFVPLKMLSWAARSSPMWFLMSHPLDLVLLFAAQPVASVYARGSKKILIEHGLDVYDSVQAIITFQDGTSAVLESSWALPNNNLPSDLPFRFEVRGTKGTVTIDLTHQALAVSGASGYTWPRTYFPTVNGRFQAFPAWMAQSFADNILGKTVPDVTVDHALAVTEVQVAIEQSVDERREVTLPLRHSQAE